MFDNLRMACKDSKYTVVITVEYWLKFTYNIGAEIHLCGGIMGAFAFPSTYSSQEWTHEDSYYTAMIAIMHLHLWCAKTHNCMVAKLCVL